MRINFDFSGRLESFKYIFFDLGGVLLNLDKNASMLKFKYLGVENIEKLVDNSFKQEFFLKYEKGLISTEEFRNEIRLFSGVNIKDELIDEAWNAFLVDIPESVLQMLREVKKKKSTFLLSNTNLLHFNFSVVNHFCKNGVFSIDDYFHRCFLSCEMHVAKPETIIFSKVLSETGAKAEECLFIDDSEQNVLAAESVGFNTYHCKGNICDEPIFSALLAMQ